VAKGSRPSRGDARRNARIGRLRAVVRPDLAVVATDLADAKRAVVVCDHDGRVLARRTYRCRAWELGAAVGWAQRHARAGGFAGVVVACEPTGHRWKVVARLAEQAGAGLVCVSPMLVARGREEDDLTRDRSDDKDALVIARLAAQLRCYTRSGPRRPGPGCGTWAPAAATSWSPPARPASSSATCWSAPARRCWARPASRWTRPAGGRRSPWRWTLAGPAGRGRPRGGRVHHQVRAQLPRWGTTRPYRPIVERVHAATAQPAGVAEQRHGATERARWLLDDWQQALAALDQVERRMVAVLGELGLAELAATIPGLSPLGAAAILAETGDPARFDSARALAKHAGLCPRDNASGPAPGRPGSPGVAGPGCAWPAGGRSGARCRTTRSCAPVTSTSPAARPTG
jgi:hypothetical protein